MKEKVFRVILGGIALESNLVLLIVIFNLVRTMMHKTKRQYSLLIGALFIIEYCIWQLFFEMMDNFSVTSYIGFDNNTVALILLQAAVTAVVVIITQMVHRWESNTLSKRSLKTGLDSLPVGLLFYWKGGMVKLVNSKMYAISGLLGQKGIYNGNEFWDMVYSKNMDISLDSQKEKKADECLVRLEDGSVYSFKRNVCMFEKHELIEVIATDVSEEQLLNEKLKIKRIKTDEIKERLKKLNSDIEKMTAEKEILETKSKVHDDLGKTLIMSRRCLDTHDVKLAAEALKQWKLNAILLRGNENDDEMFEYSNIIRDIQKLGLKVRINGTLPAERDIKKILVVALKTCATNALRHGKANEMYINSKLSLEKNIVSVREVDYIKIEISNNGILPSCIPDEGGGLSNLRSFVERNGGLMNIEINDSFTVVLRLPIGRHRIDVKE